MTRVCLRRHRTDANALSTTALGLNGLCKFVAAVLCTLVVGCGGPPQPNHASLEQDQGRTADEEQSDADQVPESGLDQSGQATKSQAVIDGSEERPKESDALLEPLRKDPRQATAHIDRIAFERMLSGDVELPIIHTTYASADYVEILRCAAGYEFTLADGRRLDSLTGANEADTRDLRKWAWTEAKGDPTFCRIVSLASSNSQTPDTAAIPGSYIYAINPCVHNHYAPTEELDNCSYQISISSPVDVTHGIETEVRDLLELYLKAESTTAGILAQVRYAAEKIVRNRDLCERGALVEQRSANLWNGIVQLAGLGINAALSAVAPGFLFSVSSKILHARDLALSLFGRGAREPPSCSQLSELFTEAGSLSEKLEEAMDKQQQAAQNLSGFISSLDLETDW
jgi:hypothetical protein